MLQGIFITIVNMSIVGGLAILLVLIVRFFLLKAPKVFSYCLWAVVLFRLLVPFSISGAFSLIPINKEPISVNLVQLEDYPIHTGFTGIDHNAMIWLVNVSNYGESNVLTSVIGMLEIVWLAGILAMLVFGVISLIRLKSKLQQATNLRDNIYQSDSVDTPFVLGLFRPRIYLPSTLKESEFEYILIHEQNHIRRGDHIARIISYFALCIHWFNPLVWIAFWASNKDMEMSNDEAVIRKMGESIKRVYSSSLLTLSTKSRRAAPVPLAFGESDPKRRIKNIISYKKPVLWVVVASIIFVAAMSVGLLLSSEKNELLYNSYEPGTTGYEIIDTLNSIKDPDDRELVAGLFFTSAYGGNTSESPGGDLSQSDEVEKMLAEMKRLAAFSGDALHKEISKVIEESIIKDLADPNIWLNRYFVETYVKEYCPEYYDRLIEQIEDNEEQGI